MQPTERQCDSPYLKAGEASVSYACSLCIAAMRVGEDAQQGRGRRWAWGTYEVTRKYSPKVDMVAVDGGVDLFALSLAQTSEVGSASSSAQALMAG